MLLEAPVMVEVMMKYHELLKIVNPRRIKVAEMKAELKIVRE